MQKNQKFVYKKFLATVLIGTMLVGVSGCNNSKENKKDITTEIPTTESTDVTTEAISEEEIFENQLVELARNSYAEYTEFYESVNYTEEDVIKMTNVINDKVEGYTEKEIESALILVRQALLSDNIIVNINEYNNFSKKVENVIKLPHLSDLVVDSNINPIIIKFESLRDELIDELIENGSYSESIAKKIRKETVQMEIEEYAEDKGKMRSEVALSKSGNLYVIAAAKMKMAHMCKVVSPKIIYLKSSNDRYIKINYTDEETDILNKIANYNADSKKIPRDLYEKSIVIEESIIGTKYYDDTCTYTRQLKQEAGYSKASQIDILKQKKSLLEARKIYQDQLLTKAKSFSYKM